MQEQELPKPTLWDQLEDFPVDEPRQGEANEPSVETSLLASVAISMKRMADALTRIVEELIKGEREA